MMVRTKTRYVCQGCGYESPKWLGRCPDCGEWDSLVEEVKKEELPPERSGHYLGAEKPLPLVKVEASEEARLRTSLGELDRVLGGGIVSGSLILVGGDPGIGKSTLLLQAANELGNRYGTVLYVSGEESVRQTKLRANRLGTFSERIYIVSETNTEIIEEYVREFNPLVLVIDSIQTVYRPDLPSAPGSVSQVRESAAQFMHLAKRLGVAVFLVGHVTKEGSLAGPRVLEHIVDTVLYFEGERFHTYRILRAVKNRFGSTNEVGIFEMRESGLVEVPNPSQIFLTGRPTNVPGSVVVSTMEGTRPILVELQALVSPTSFAIPQRMATGVDYRRLSLLLAVLERRVGLRLSNQDVFLNVVGGIKVEEPAIDLGIVMAVASSFKNRPLDAKTVVFGEVGLGGEVRAVSQVERRISEIDKLGFQRCVTSVHNLRNIKEKAKIEVLGIRDVQEGLEALLA